jgi:hypothetical protein
MSGVMASTIQPKGGDPIQSLALDLKVFVAQQLNSVAEKDRTKAIEAIRAELKKGGAELTSGWHARIETALKVALA